MFESVITSLLNEYLGTFLLGLDSDQLSLSLWSGNVKLENLSVRPSCLEFLHLPITVIEGTVKKISISANWRKLTSHPVKVDLEGIFLLVGEKNEIFFDEKTEINLAQKAKKVKLTAWENFKMESEKDIYENQLREGEEETEGETEGEGEGGKNPNVTKAKESSYIDKLTSKIIDNIEVTIKDLHIRFVSSSPFPQNDTLSIGLVLRELSSFTVDKLGKKCFSENDNFTQKEINLSQLGIYCNINDKHHQNDKEKEEGKSNNTDNNKKKINTKTDSTSTSSSSFLSSSVLLTDPDTNYLVLPISGQMHVNLNKSFVSDFSSPKLSVNSLLDSIVLSLSSLHFQYLLMTISSLSECQKKMKTLIATFSTTFRPFHSLAEAREYIALYKREMNLFWLKELSPEERKLLNSYDDKIHFDEILKARQVVWEECKIESGGKFPIMRKDKWREEKKEILKREKEEGSANSGGFLSSLFKKKDKEKEKTKGKFEEMLNPIIILNAQQKDEIFLRIMNGTQDNDNDNDNDDDNDNEIEESDEDDEQKEKEKDSASPLSPTKDNENKSKNKIKLKSKLNPFCLPLDFSLIDIKLQINEISVHLNENKIGNENNESLKPISPSFSPSPIPFPFKSKVQVQSNVLSFSSLNSSFHFSQFPTSNMVKFNMENLSLTDNMNITSRYTQLIRFPNAKVKENGKGKEDFLRLFVLTTPVFPSPPCDLLVDFHVLSPQIILPPPLITRIFSFFTPWTKGNFEVISEWSAQQISSIKTYSANSLSSSLAKHKSLHINVHISDPTFIIPYDIFHPNHYSLVVNLGSLTMSPLILQKKEKIKKILNPKSKGKTNGNSLFEAKKMSDLNPNIIKYLYDTFQFEIQKTQIFITKDKDTQNANGNHFEVNDESFHLLLPFSVTLFFHQCIARQISFLPNMKLNGNLKDIIVKFGNGKMEKLVTLGNIFQNLTEGEEKRRKRITVAVGMEITADRWKNQNDNGNDKSSSFTSISPSIPSSASSPSPSMLLSSKSNMKTFSSLSSLNDKNMSNSHDTFNVITLTALLGDEKLAKRILKEIDVDGNGVITKDEFSQWEDERNKKSLYNYTLEMSLSINKMCFILQDESGSLESKGQSVSPLDILSSQIDDFLLSVDIFGSKIRFVTKVKSLKVRDGVGNKNIIEAVDSHSSSYSSSSSSSSDTFPSPSPSLSPSPSPPFLRFELEKRSSLSMNYNPSVIELNMALRLQTVHITLDPKGIQRITSYVAITLMESMKGKTQFAKNHKADDNNKDKDNESVKDKDSDSVLSQLKQLNEEIISSSSLSLTPSTPSRHPRNHRTLVQFSAEFHSISVHLLVFDHPFSSIFLSGFSLFFQKFPSSLHSHLTLNYFHMRDETEKGKNYPFIITAGKGTKGTKGKKEMGEENKKDKDKQNENENSEQSNRSQSLNPNSNPNLLTAVGSSASSSSFPSPTPSSPTNSLLRSAVSLPPSFSPSAPSDVDTDSSPSSSSSSLSLSSSSSSLIDICFDTYDKRDSDYPSYPSKLSFRIQFINVTLIVRFIREMETFFLCGPIGNLIKQMENQRKQNENHQKSESLSPSPSAPPPPTPFQFSESNFVKCDFHLHDVGLIIPKNSQRRWKFTQTKIFSLRVTNDLKRKDKDPNESLGNSFPNEFHQIFHLRLSEFLVSTVNKNSKKNQRNQISDGYILNLFEVDEITLETTLSLGPVSNISLGTNVSAIRLTLSPCQMEMIKDTMEHNWMEEENITKGLKVNEKEKVNGNGKGRESSAASAPSPSPSPSFSMVISVSLPHINLELFSSLPDHDILPLLPLPSLNETKSQRNLRGQQAINQQILRGKYSLIRLEIKEFNTIVSRNQKDKMISLVVNSTMDQILMMDSAAQGQGQVVILPQYKQLISMEKKKDIADNETFPFRFHLSHHSDGKIISTDIETEINNFHFSASPALLKVVREFSLTEKSKNAHDGNHNNPNILIVDSENENQNVSTVNIPNKNFEAMKFLRNDRNVSDAEESPSPSPSPISPSSTMTIRVAIVNPKISLIFSPSLPVSPAAILSWGIHLNINISSKTNDNNNVLNVTSVKGKIANVQMVITEVEGGDKGEGESVSVKEKLHSQMYSVILFPFSVNIQYHLTEWKSSSASPFPFPPNVSLPTCPLNPSVILSNQSKNLPKVDSLVEIENINIRFSYSTYVLIQQMVQMITQIDWERERNKKGDSDSSSPSIVSVPVSFSPRSPPPPSSPLFSTAHSPPPSNDKKIPMIFPPKKMSIIGSHSDAIPMPTIQRERNEDALLPSPNFHLTLQQEEISTSNPSNSLPNKDKDNDKEYKETKSSQLEDEDQNPSVTSPSRPSQFNIQFDTNTDTICHTHSNATLSSTSPIPLRFLRLFSNENIRITLSGGVSLSLVNDALRTDLIFAKFQFFSFSLLVHSFAHCRNMRIQFGLNANFYNSKLSAWEPMVEESKVAVNIQQHIVMPISILVLNYQYDVGSGGGVGTEDGSGTLSGNSKGKLSHFLSSIAQMTLPEIEEFNISTLSLLVHSDPQIALNPSLYGHLITQIIIDIPTTLDINVSHSMFSTVSDAMKLFSNKSKKSKKEKKFQNPNEKSTKLLDAPTPIADPTLTPANNENSNENQNPSGSLEMFSPYQIDNSTDIPIQFYIQNEDPKGNENSYSCVSPMTIRPFSFPPSCDLANLEIIFSLDSNWIQKKRFSFRFNTQTLKGNIHTHQVQILNTTASSSASSSLFFVSELVFREGMKICRIRSTVGILNHTNIPFLMVGEGNTKAKTTANSMDKSNNPNPSPSPSPPVDFPLLLPKSEFWFPLSFSVSETKIQFCPLDGGKGHSSPFGFSSPIALSHRTNPQSSTSPSPTPSPIRFLCLKKPSVVIPLEIKCQNENFSRIELESQIIKSMSGDFGAILHQEIITKGKRDREGEGEGNESDDADFGSLFHLRPSAVIENLLNCDCEMSLYETTNDGNLSLVQRQNVHRGAKFPIYFSAVNQSAKIAFRIPSLHTVGWSSPVIPISFQEEITNTMSTQISDSDGRKLNLFVDFSTVHSALRVFLYVPYWVFDLTSMGILISPNKKSTVPLGGISEFSANRSSPLKNSVMFSFPMDKEKKDSKVYFSTLDTVSQSSNLSEIPWSEKFSLDTIGHYKVVNIPQKVKIPENKGKESVPLLYPSNDIGLSITKGSGRWKRTKMVTLSPHIFAVNSINFPIEIQQDGVDETLKLLRGEQKGFGWKCEKRKKFLRFRRCGPSFENSPWDWSGLFDPNVISDTPLIVQNGEFHNLLWFCRVEIRLQNSAIYLIFHDYHSSPFVTPNILRSLLPYRIENFTLHHTLRIRQFSVSKSHWIYLSPYSQIPFAWSHPMEMKIIEIEIGIQRDSGKFQSEKRWEISLDFIDESDNDKSTENEKVILQPLQQDETKRNPIVFKSLRLDGSVHVLSFHSTPPFDSIEKEMKNSSKFSSTEIANYKQKRKIFDLETMEKNIFHSNQILSEKKEQEKSKIIAINKGEISRPNEVPKKDSALLVKILHGKNLIPSTHFVKCSFLSASSTTVTIKDNRNPTWNRQFIFQANDVLLSSRCVLELFSVGIFSNDLVGKVEFTLRDFDHHKPVEVEMFIQTVGNKSKSPLPPSPLSLSSQSPNANSNADANLGSITALIWFISPSLSTVSTSLSSVSSLLSETKRVANEIKSEKELWKRMNLYLSEKTSEVEFEVSILQFQGMEDIIRSLPQCPGNIVCRITNQMSGITHSILLFSEENNIQNVLQSKMVDSKDQKFMKILRENAMGEEKEKKGKQGNNENKEKENTTDNEIKEMFLPFIHSPLQWKQKVYFSIPEEMVHEKKEEEKGVGEMRGNVLHFTIWFIPLGIAVGLDGNLIMDIPIGKSAISLCDVAVREENGNDKKSQTQTQSQYRNITLQTMSSSSPPSSSSRIPSPSSSSSSTTPFSPTPSCFISLSRSPLRSCVDVPELSFSFHMKSLGFSLINDLPEEILYLSIHDVDLSLSETKFQQMFAFSIENFQLDNQSYHCSYPNILGPSPVEMEDLQDILQVSITKSKTKKSSVPLTSVDNFQYVSILLQSLDVKVEESLIWILLEYANQFQFPMDDDDYEDGDNVSTIVLRSSSLPLSSPSNGILFFHFLQIQPICVNISFISQPNLRKNSSHSTFLWNPFEFVLNVAGSALGSIESAPLQLNGRIIENALGNPQVIIGSLVELYLNDIITQAYKIVGSLEVLGNPVCLLNGLGTGVTDFFYLPSKGIVKSPKDFGIGLAKGSLSLLKGTFAGIFMAASKITSSLGRGAAMLSMDEEFSSHQERNAMAQQQPSNVATGLAKGVTQFGKGIFKGITGIVVDPYKGAKKDGVSGFLKGAAKGIAGIVAKPVAGTIQGLSTGMMGIANTANIFDHKTQIHRIRPTRSFDSSQILRPFNQAEAEKYEKERKAKKKAMAKK